MTRSGHGQLTKQAPLDGVSALKNRLRSGTAPPPRFRAMLIRKQEAGMEDLILAVVTFAASAFILTDATRAGIHAFIVITCVASMPVAGYLAYERGRSPWRWAFATAAIGPLAISALYLVSGISAFRKMNTALRS